MSIAPGVSYAAWTFGGTVPGPVQHVRQGDTVDFTLVNEANIPHSMDFHAAEIAPSKYYVNIMPGDSLHYRFVARVPGAFMYHCGTAPVAMHIANGMYGALIVDPATPRPKARELVFVQSEFYETAKPAGRRHREPRLAEAARPGPGPHRLQRAGQPVRRPPGRRAAERAASALPGERGSQPDQLVPRGGRHLRAGVRGRLAGESAEGVQTVNVPVGGGSIFELRLRQPGDYPFVTHAFADATKGAVGVLRAGEPGKRVAAGPAAH